MIDFNKLVNQIVCSVGRANNEDLLFMVDFLIEHFHYYQCNVNVPRNFDDLYLVKKELQRRITNEQQN